MLYKQLIQTGSVLLLLPLSSVLGFPLYEDTANGRAATHQLYSFAIEFGLIKVKMFVLLAKKHKKIKLNHIFLFNRRIFSTFSSIQDDQTYQLLTFAALISTEGSREGLLLLVLLRI